MPRTPVTPARPLRPPMLSMVAKNRPSPIVSTGTTTSRIALFFNAFQT